MLACLSYSPQMAFSYLLVARIIRNSLSNNLLCSFRSSMCSEVSC